LKDIPLKGFIRFKLSTINEDSCILLFAMRCRRCRRRHWK